MKKHSLPTLPKDIKVIDTHCHLDMDAYQEDGFAQVLANALQNGVSKIITIGTNLESSIAAIKLAQAHDNVFATIGVHPHDVDSMDQKTYETLTQLAKTHPAEVVGYGEIGLDYAKLHTPAELQKEHFAKQLELAQELQLPVSIHCRDAQEDMVEILRAIAPLPQGGVIHCFSGDKAFAHAVLELGFYISIPGIITFKNAQELQEVCQMVPLERLLLETDGPFLAPVPYRGKRNEPAYVLYTLEKVANLREISIIEVALQTTQNAQNLFHI
ncbi:TatD family hydrolase [Desulfotalea psychrophila]|uniref:Hydrolase TatD n=1 Tax=Desulfotalea psychrophila (strain LSv54 / DSM 12343) TaxID=177439 RepID=Q6AJH2_DESPS|nr:TatD family hydrolase [Desulfotalea psychrophila]CAG37508.1 conserved hypothetical protein [Desulfotalea psychrophila LSv54]